MSKGSVEKSRQSTSLWSTNLRCTIGNLNEKFTGCEFGFRMISRIRKDWDHLSLKSRVAYNSFIKFGIQDDSKIIRVWLFLRKRHIQPTLFENVTVSDVQHLADKAVLHTTFKSTVIRLLSSKLFHKQKRLRKNILRLIIYPKNILGQTIDRFDDENCVYDFFDMVLLVFDIIFNILKEILQGHAIARTFFASIGHLKIIEDLLKFKWLRHTRNIFRNGFVYSPIRPTDKIFTKDDRADIRVQEH